MAVRILEVTSYPPPRAGWGVRVEFVKKRLEEEGHQCVVLNIGSSRNIPSTEYETVLGGADFVRKVWKYSRAGFVVHAHANGDALKGTVLALVSLLINRACGQRPILTFHAGVIQRYFPRRSGGRHFPLYWLLFAIPRKVICNSDAVKACIREYGVPAEKIAAIPAFSRQYLEFDRVPLPAQLEAFFSTYPSVVFTYVRMRPLFYPMTLVQGMALVMSRRPDVGLVMCGMAGHSDPGVRPEVEAEIRQSGIEPRVCILDDLDHDAFLTALLRSSLYLRTPITDGVASSVLESLALGIPVVACENGTRPAGVLTYPAADHEKLAAAVERVLDDRDRISVGLRQTDVPDTVADEVSLLTA